MDNKLYKFGLDWLNGVLPLSDVHSVFEMLGMFSCKLAYHRWQLSSCGLYNYSRRYLLDGKAFIQLMYNPVSDEEYLTADINHNNSGVFFSISGDGIRYLHSLGGDVSALNKLLYYFYRNSFKASRFDVYCDILDKDNLIVPLIVKAFQMNGHEAVGEPGISTRFRRNDEDNLSRRFSRKNFKVIPLEDDNGEIFHNVQLGNHGSSIGMFRCYNKLIELRDSRLSEVSAKICSTYDVDSYWYRLEYEMHKDNAAACFWALMSRAEDENAILSLNDIFYSVFERVFCIHHINTIGTPICKQEIHSIWASFCRDIQASSIDLAEFKPHAYVTCSLTRVEKNAKRISGHLYQINQWLSTLSLDERRRFWVRAKDSYLSNKRYNEFRDELDDIRSATEQNLKNPLTWRQMDLSDFDIQLFA